MSLVSNNWILYDGECPFCKSYVALVRLREAVGPVRILNVRDGGPEVDLVQAVGLDLDEGMVLNYQDRLYHGDDCVHMLAMLSETGGVLRSSVAWVFRSPRRARLLYPWLRKGRNVTLKLLRKQKIGKA
jgi:predicted DCC family thiol-disulfide oxidoreductase YuxK